MPLFWLHNPNPAEQMRTVEKVVTFCVTLSSNYSIKELEGTVECNSLAELGLMFAWLRHTFNNMRLHLCQALVDENSHSLHFCPFPSVSMELPCQQDQVMTS